MRTRHFVETYEKHVSLSHNPVTWVWALLLVLALALLPLVASSYVIALATTAGIAAIGAIGLNILTGSTGLISLGQAGFLASGCYTTGLLIADYNWPPELALVMAGVVPALLSLLVGVPSLRLKGLYLAITTMAFSFIVTHFLLYAEGITHGPYGVRVEDLDFFGLDLATTTGLYTLVLITAILVTLMALNILRTRVGRAFTAIRDHDIAARVMGISLVRYKLLAFMISSFFVGIAGGLMAFQFRFINVDIFNVLLSIEALGDDHRRRARLGRRGDHGRGLHRAPARGHARGAGPAARRRQRHALDLHLRDPRPAHRPHDHRHAAHQAPGPHRALARRTAILDPVAPIQMTIKPNATG